jgi:ribosomal protein S18 acetylase RimI-like enzyme
MLINSTDKNLVSSQYSSVPAKQSYSRKTVSGGADVFFKSGKEKDKKYKNPINSGFEYLDAAKLTAGAGLLIAGRVLVEAISDGFFDSVKDIKKLAILSLAIGGAYAALSLPKNLYNRKVEIFRRKKEMGIYINTNSAEQGLYEKIDSEAKKADEKRKKELSQEYLKLGTRKNQLPEFIKEYQK